jgi:class 3 adenylate cyclase
VVELDGAAILGRQIRLEGVERLLGGLAKTGYHYDFRERRLVSSCRDTEALVDWGCLRVGREYEVTIASLDVAGSSALVRTHGLRRMEKVYLRLWNHLRERLAALDGRIWSWAGDGGIAAFVFDDHVARAARFALEVQRTLPVFNATMDDHLPAEVALRIGLDTGPVRFAAEPGQIVSDVINYAAHLEKQVTPPGAVAVSKAVRDALPARLAAFFSIAGCFEDRAWYVAAEGAGGNGSHGAGGNGKAAGGSGKAASDNGKAAGRGRTVPPARRAPARSPAFDRVPE